MLAPVGIAFILAEMAMSATSEIVTAAHIRHLEQIIVNHGHVAHDGTVTAILFTIAKKNKKLKRKQVGCIPVLGSFGNTVYTIGRTIKKRKAGTRGEARRHFAEVMWRNMRNGDLCARVALTELLTPKIFHRIRDYDDGFRVLKKQMRSLYGVGSGNTHEAPRIIAICGASSMLSTVGVRRRRLVTHSRRRRHMRSKVCPADRTAPHALTATSVRDRIVTCQPYTVRDTREGGFASAVRRSGKKSITIDCRVSGDRTKRRMVLGTFPSVTPEETRGVRHLATERSGHPPLR